MQIVRELWMDLQIMCGDVCNRFVVRAGAPRPPEGTRKAAKERVECAIAPWTRRWSVACTAHESRENVFAFLVMPLEQFHCVPSDPHPLHACPTHTQGSRGLGAVEATGLGTAFDRDMRNLHDCGPFAFRL